MMNIQIANGGQVNSQSNHTQSFMIWMMAGSRVSARKAMAVQVMGISRKNT
ncbi:hypothetical protein D3C86_2158730 [compost metagenome]